MRPSTGPVLAPGQRSRAQQEVVGVTLLTAVVVIVALSVGTVIVAQSSGDEAGPRTDVRVAANDTHLTLTNNGGDSLALTDLTVTLEQGSTRNSFVPEATNATGSDDRLDPGERVVREHDFAAGDVDVLVAHRPSSTVLRDDRVTVPA